ncbi:MAG TPA: hypothetical protein VI911_11720 [Patescibacteria group bacterium]|nr:hypothetical protein [Patescibacteria group bacterium]
MFSKFSDDQLRILSISLHNRIEILNDMTEVLMESEIYSGVEEESDKVWELHDLVKKEKSFRVSKNSIK